MRNDLRVYFLPPGPTVPDKTGVFFSRRSSGPYYRWSLDQEPDKWRGLRVRPTIGVIRSLRLASWITVPPSLQARLEEHYLE
jgi:hypothetical protein